MVRIIAGSFKSRQLKTGKNRSIRPTQGRVKEILFSKLGDMEGLRVTDLFAGTGNLGFEALSRLADHCTFIDNNRLAINIIRANAIALDVLNQVEIRCVDVLRYMSHPEIADLYFADPPYGYEYLDELGEAFVKLPQGTTIVLESGRDMPIPKNIENKLASRRIIGETSLNFIKV